MGWEERGNGIYYYRKIRDGDTVRSEYVGNGPLARIASELDNSVRELRDAEWQLEKIKRAQDDDIESQLAAIEGSLKFLTRAHLISLGFSQTSSREWRLSRNGKQKTPDSIG